MMTWWRKKYSSLSVPSSPREQKDFKFYLKTRGLFGTEKGWESALGKYTSKELLKYSKLKGRPGYRTQAEFERSVAKSRKEDRKEAIQRQREYMADYWGRTLEGYQKETEPIIKQLSAEQAKVSAQLKPKVTGQMIRPGSKTYMPYRQRIKYVAWQRKQQRQAEAPYVQAKSNIKAQEAAIRKEKQKWVSLTK